MTNLQAVVVLSQLKLVAAAQSWDDEKYEALEKAVELFDSIPEHHGDLIDADLLVQQLEIAKEEGVLPRDAADTVIHAYVNEAPAVIASTNDPESENRRELKGYIKQLKLSIAAEDGSAPEIYD